MHELMDKNMSVTSWIIWVRIRQKMSLLLIDLDFFDTCNLNGDVIRKPPTGRGFYTQLQTNIYKVQVKHISQSSGITSDMSPRLVGPNMGPASPLKQG